MKHAQFTTHINTPVISIRDVGDHSQVPTVTNDAEWVVEQIQKALRANGDDIKNYHVIYRDTQGYWDGFDIQNGKFNTFIGLQCTSERAARSKILDHKYTHS